MSRKQTSYRRKAFLEQSGRCFYCSAEMWLTHPERFASRHGLSEREAWRFKCTAEHLVARCDGGSDSQTNIVAACRFCNATRHQIRCAQNRRRMCNTFTGGLGQDAGTPADIDTCF
jgi:hypothetical protein